MPLRPTPLVTGEVYHVISRTVGSIPLFQNARDYKRFLLAFQYYQNQNLPFKFSKWLKLPVVEKEKLFADLKESKNLLVEIIAFCLMPTHYHFLLRQTQDDGILNFIRLTTNSYSKYFNIKYERAGSLFAGRFKAIRVKTEEQLFHLSRYIHLNPYSGFLVKNLKDILSYPYSSLVEYLNPKTTFICQKEMVLSYFKNPKEYQKFIVNQADYQRNLAIIKHQLLEDN